MVADPVTVIAMNTLCSMTSECERNKAIICDTKKITFRTPRADDFWGSWCVHKNTSSIK